MKRTKLFFSYVLLVVAIVAVTATASEIALRMTGHVSAASIHTISQADYVRVPGMFEPHQDVVEKPHPRLNYHVTINGLGYRGHEIRRDKPDGTVRVLLLGDSGTFGQFVNDEDTLSSYLQDDLRREGLAVEVINGGVPGTTIVDQLEVLRRGMILRPDVVILTFSENDITDLGAEVPQSLALARNRELKSRTGYKLLYEFVRDTALFNYVLKVKAVLAMKAGAHGEAGPSSSSQADDRAHEAYEVQWKRYGDYLDELKRYLAERRIELVFNVFPTHQRIGAMTITDRDLLVQLERAEAMAQAKGIRTVEVLPTFLRSGLGKEELYLLPYDGHANKNGYRLQATALLPAVRDAVHRAMPRFQAPKPSGETAIQDVAQALNRER